jgi:hypothetical protein
VSKCYASFTMFPVSPEKFPFPEKSEKSTLHVAQAQASPAHGGAPKSDESDRVGRRKQKGGSSAVTRPLQRAPRVKVNLAAQS